MATNSETGVRPYERLQVHTAKETFVSIDNGGVSYSVVKVTTYNWRDRGLSSSGKLRPCFSWLKGNHKVCTVACVLGLVVLLWYLWSSED